MPDARVTVTAMFACPRCDYALETDLVLAQVSTSRAKEVLVPDKHGFDCPGCKQRLYLHPESYVSVAGTRGAGS